VSPYLHDRVRARNSADHAFADEVSQHLAALPNARSHVRYSRPAPSDSPGRDYGAEGHVALEVLQDLGVPLAAAYYVCGPTARMRELSAGLLT
jgi:ferredoxin-NADP reductase